MAYEDFTGRFKEVRSQHNIMALVGNGFDIQALSGIGSLTDTRYESFYHYLKYRKFDATNLILERMEALRADGAENWSDVENAIESLRTVDQVCPERVSGDVRKIQREFANFLDQVATPDVLSRLGEDAVSQKKTMVSFTEFLGDIEDPDEYKRLGLIKRLGIGDVFNFKFVNFNYTTLLDDFVYLDQEQFDPHPHKWSDRNIYFHPNPRGHEGGHEDSGFHMVAYLVSDVVHPHGIQYTPRSLLFGIDEAEGAARKLSKPYWAQNKVKYADLFSTTDLFIIFGCSLGDTDRWWWRAIVDGLRGNDDADLILYWRRGARDEHLTARGLRQRFAKAAGYAGDPDVRRLLIERARVVLYDDGPERAWLNTNATSPPSWAEL
ncbi:AbiH family protein [Pseudarthrobacter cellobiosi]|uniref:AbiH family protein n=1 Tax=Pseudarthrobacter cellobiosi TaxID=2953654 RepID=UPI00208F338C|nr:AbiH family protein [Pseudarthrobacter sp. HLT1-5]MCO4253895.1 bacteriophage abortive infection AbiH family protein [Pseudarthrobacter sp. HLT1-5]